MNHRTSSGADRGLESARRAGAARLAGASVAAPALDARLLLQAATGLDAAALAADPSRPLTEDETTRFEGLLARRAAREPMSQILGRAGFWTIELAVTADVLSPRPETETVLEAALEATADRPTGRALDLGVGPGTLLLTFLVERPGWTGVGVDLSASALAVARANARALDVADRVDLVCSDWDAALAPGTAFDLALANPPYVATAEIDALEPEVRDHEPRLALDGGPDGLEAYRQLAPALARRLLAGGTAVLEVGAGQAEAVAELVGNALSDAQVTSKPDLAGRPRAVVARRPRGSP